MEQQHPNHRKPLTPYNKTIQNTNNNKNKRTTQDPTQTLNSNNNDNDNSMSHTTPLEPFPERNLENKIIVVTGASRGLGNRLAQLLAQRKATLVLTARDQSSLDTAVNDIKTSTGNDHVYGFVCDQGKLESVNEFFRQFSQKFSHIDVLVNNASIMPGYGMETIDDQLDIDTFRINVEGVFMVTKKALPFMFASPNKDFERTVIFVSSSAGWLTEPEEGCGMISYRASKAAENGIMVGLHQMYVEDTERTREVRGGDSSKYLNRVVSLHPGFVATGLGKETWMDKSHDHSKISELKLGFGAIPIDSGVDTMLWLIAAESGVQSGKTYYERKVHSF